MSERNGERNGLHRRLRCTTVPERMLYAFACVVLLWDRLL